MTLNTSEKWEVPLANSSPPCSWNMSDWEHQMEKMYTYFYLILFIPGLLLNTMALWVLCKYIRDKSKTVIFMINLALADLAHILSLPLRIYYYCTHTWPFGRGMCLFCFYLKYLNMYAAIAFLVCISVQRCVFLLNPFYARRWRRRYEILISVTVWVFVSLGCSPFIIMRSSTSNLSNGILSVSHNTSFLMDATSNPHPLSYTNPYTPPLNSTLPKPTPTAGGCFKDLPMRRLSVSLAVTMMALAELFGFVIPLVCISYSSIRITWSLYQRQAQDQQTSNMLNSAARSRLQSVSSNGQLEKCSEKQTNAEKQRALLMVLSCFILFLVCFVPYHLNFLLYLMVSQGIVSHCATEITVRKFHPVSLCLANLSCCLNPLLYYFLTAEFRQHLTRRVSSFTSSLLSSPISSPTQRLAPHRMMSMDSSCSDREEHN